jgi:hypothetical protein
MSKKGCKKCDYTGWLEIDPSNPEEAGTPKYVRCDCFEDDEDQLYREAVDKELGR